MVLGLGEGFVGRQVYEIEKGIRLGVEQFYKDKEVCPEAISKIMTSLYMGVVLGSIAHDDVDVKEGEKMIDKIVDFFLR